MAVGFTTISAYHHWMSSNPAHGEVCSIQNYVSLSVTCDRSVVFSTSKTDRHDINEILLKMALKTTTITHNLSKWKWTGPYSFSLVWNVDYFIGSFGYIFRHGSISGLHLSGRAWQDRSWVLSTPKKEISMFLCQIIQNYQNSVSACHFLQLLGIHNSH